MQRDSRAMIGLPFSAITKACRSSSWRISSGRMIAMSSPENVRPAVAPACQFVREIRVWPARSEISWLKAPSLEPPNITNTLVRPNKARFLLAEDRSQLPPGLRGVYKGDAEGAFVGHPGPQRRQRRGRGQLIQTGHHRWAQPAPPRPARKQQS